MANVAYHTHQFEIPTASEADGAAGIDNSKAMTALSTAAAIAAQSATVGDGQLARSALQPDDIGISVASAAQGDKADSALQPSDLSTTATINKGLQAYNVDGSGIPGVGIPTNGLIFRQSNGLQQNGGVFRVERLANYSGGTFGFENAAFSVKNTVSAGADSFEDALLAVLDNSANGTGQNTAGRFQANKRGTGGVWSLANETIDWSGVADPTMPSIGIEQAMRVNGTDANTVRIAYDAILTRPQISGAYNGAAAQGSVAFRAGNDYFDNTVNNNWKTGFQALANGNGSMGNAFEAKSAAGTAKFSCGLNLSAMVLQSGGVGIKLTADMPLSFSANNDRTLRYATGAGLAFYNGSVNHWVLSDNGSTNQFGTISINGTQVVTSRRTGWAGDTGTAKRSANATYSATAEATYTQATVQTLMNTVRDLSQTIKALKDDLIAHGLIGS